MPFTCVLFDLDGTLLDTLDDLAGSCNRTLASFGFPIHAPESYRYLVGDGINMLFARALPEDQRNDAMIERCIDAYRADYSANWNVATRIYPEMADLLDVLAARQIKLAVLSNKLHEFTTACCSHYLSRWRFEVVLGQTPDLPRKPDPAPALEIARRMNEPPGNFLYLGDTATDMLTASAAGMYPVGALWGFRTAKELRESGARTLVSSPLELLRLL